MQLGFDGQDGHIAASRFRHGGLQRTVGKFTQVQLPSEDLMDDGKDLLGCLPNQALGYVHPDTPLGEE